jgi:tryptophan-rich sensory protein
VKAAFYILFFIALLIRSLFVLVFFEVFVLRLALVSIIIVLFVELLAHSAANEACTARGFWDTGLKPTPPRRRVEAASVERLTAS